MLTYALFWRKGRSKVPYDTDPEQTGQGLACLSLCGLACCSMSCSAESCMGWHCYNWQLVGKLFLERHMPAYKLVHGVAPSCCAHCQRPCFWVSWVTTPLVATCAGFWFQHPL